jgi:hypothetical protein
MDGDRLVGFFDWDTAGPSSRENDLAISAITWVPLASNQDERLDVHDIKDRSRGFHLLLDSYGYDGDRHGFRAVIPQRARRQAGVIRDMAGAGDPAMVALLPIADRLERCATDVEALPDDFWR